MRAHAKHVIIVVVAPDRLLAPSSVARLAATPARVLYVTQSADFAHPVLAHSEEVLVRLGDESGEFEVDVSHDASTLTAACFEITRPWSFTRPASCQ